MDTNIGWKVAAGIAVLLLALSIAGKIERSEIGNSIKGNGVVYSEPITCEEDMACWDCSTMGNLICGPTFESEIK